MADAVTSDALGLVAGTVPATPLKYSVSLAPGQYAQLDDVVVTERGLPGRGGIQIAGVVTNIEAMHEGARFASDVFLIEQGALPAEVSEVAEVTVTRVEPEMYVPPLPGAPVTRAAGAQRDSTLYFDAMRRRARRKVFGAERRRARARERIGQPGGRRELTEQVALAGEVEVSADHGARSGLVHDPGEHGELVAVQRMKPVRRGPVTVIVERRDG